MDNFKNVHFKGDFRDYQQRVLDNADEYLKDGKINIVAAPGSGKTVLGLELIRRLNAPCIILSPTTAIRQQWGERFKVLFLDDSNDFNELFSNDLHNVRLLNSVTYQALYSAVEKVSPDDNEDSDCSDIDLFNTIKEFGIKTICLDEAHHLKNKWQKALEKFISALDNDIKIVSLTATPPYDSDVTEWNRYINVCGEIDEEIFVPELVAQNTLCPHQDYVYFNYPAKDEAESLHEFREHAAAALDELGGLELFGSVCNALNKERKYEVFFSSVKEYIALIILLRHYHFEIREKLINELTTNRGLPKFKMSYAETAVQFLLDGEIITPERKSEIVEILKKNSVYEKRKVTLELNEKLKRTLISSVGKLDSIRKIVESEEASLGSRLRMLVLTDYIKKESLSKISTAEAFHSVNVVSIFETIRRTDINAKIGVLSGTLVILPESIDLSDIKCRKESIPNTDYCTVEFSGSVQNSVDYVSRLFEKGDLQILIGTKSLLGEGWDSPCINSLILASFVGSFVLSNQMRGRAIRIDKNDPKKTANIWHLVTVEPEFLFKENSAERLAAYAAQDRNELVSYDYEILKRRFDTFMAPNYISGVIESGIERITAIKPPFDKKGIEEINREMLSLSTQREDVRCKWSAEVADGSFSVEVESIIPKEKRVPVFVFNNIAVSFITVLLEITLLRSLFNSTIQRSIPLALGALAVMVLLAPLLLRAIKIAVLHFNPAKSIKELGSAVYKTLCECDLISPSAKLEITSHKELYYVILNLRNASIHSQNIFNTAMAELLSPIENPRYILIAKSRLGFYNYTLSYACPTIIGKKREHVEVLAKNLKLSTGNFEPVYTHRESGRELILKCRKRSYITANEKMINSKYKVSHWE